MSPAVSKAQARLMAAKLKQDLDAGRISRRKYEAELKKWMQGYSKLPGRKH